MKPPKHHSASKAGKPHKHFSPTSKGRHSAGILPNVAALVVTAVTEAGDIFAAPAEWKGRNKPNIVVIDEGRGFAPAKGDGILAKMHRITPYSYEARIIRLLPKALPQKIVGTFVSVKRGGGFIEPVSRKITERYSVTADDMNDARHGELVSASLIPDGFLHGMKCVRIEERLGDIRSPRAASLIAAHLHNLPMMFSHAAIHEAQTADAPRMETGREDIRHVPLVTIDGEDARDFDDAVFAEPDTDPANAGGFHLIVAIADVAYYVREDSALDQEAYARGNSVYFPDRVIPMLPERLSNGLCSLKPEEDRYCIAVHIWIDNKGTTKRYHFIRALMRSHARLTYTQVEKRDDIASPSLIQNLFAAYRILASARDARGALELELPEYKVQFDAAGHVSSIAPKQPLESHRLIEAFMVTANVAAAHFLLTHNAPGLYRVHEPPSQEKIDTLRNFLGLSGYSFPKGAITPIHLNRVLREADAKPEAAIIHTAVLRSQMQAFYDPRNLGHFGLGLREYCHFTSPIRRYSDLIVHRSLTALIAKNPSALPTGNLGTIALHISATERTAMMAERDAMDRYKIAYISRLPDTRFKGIVTSLQEFGIHVSLEGNGITGFVPVSNLGNDYFHYDKRSGRFKGERSKQTYAIGDSVIVEVVEANAIKGSLILRTEGGAAQSPSYKKHTRKKKHRKKNPPSKGKKTKG